MNQRTIFLKFRNFSSVIVILLLMACDAKEETKSTSAPISPTETKSESVSGISGKVVLKGAPPPEREMQMDPACGKLHATIPKTRLYVVNTEGALADVFIYIKEGLEGKTFSPRTEPALLDQINCEYTPYVLGLQTGQKLLVRNSDPMMHNVHPTPKISGNRESNKAQMAKSPDFEYTFEKPEIFITYKCDVHPWMYAYVGVVEHPFFAVSDKDGKFQIENIPDGKYVLEAFHRKAGKQTKEIVVADGKSAPVDFEFEISAQ